MLQAAKDNEIAALMRGNKEPAGRPKQSSATIGSLDQPSGVPSASPKNSQQQISTQRTNTQQPGQAPKTIMQSIQATRKRHGGVAGITLLSLAEVIVQAVF